MNEDPTVKLGWTMCHLRCNSEHKICHYLPCVTGGCLENSHYDKQVCRTMYNVSRAIMTYLDSFIACGMVLPKSLSL